MKIGGAAIPQDYQRSIENFQPGPGVFKLDYALSSPFLGRLRIVLRAATIHLGGTFEEIEAPKKSIGRTSGSTARLFCRRSPLSLIRLRAPEGKHVALGVLPCSLWIDRRHDRSIEAQIERFAPGFKHTILNRTKSFPRDLEKQNRNLVGGDISGGAPTPMQLFFRPALKWIRIGFRGIIPGGSAHLRAAGCGGAWDVRVSRGGVCSRKCK